MDYDFSAWPKLPFVSCQCLTFGRPAMLNEAVECFLRQDYPGPKECVRPRRGQEGYETIADREKT